MRKFDELPERFQNEAVRKYYDILKKKRVSLFFKRVFDFVIALIIFIVLLPLNLVVGVLVKCTSEGPVFYRQVRIGRYGKPFRIFKFRTMVQNADKIGAQLTVGERDPRITKIGHFLRKTRLDEFAQVINILLGQMCLVGARPEVPKYVEQYSDEMMATLLLAPGISGEASLEFKDENELLAQADDFEQCYITQVLPEKMRINLEYLTKLSVWYDFKLLVRTFFAIFS